MLVQIKHNIYLTAGPIWLCLSGSRLFYVEKSCPNLIEKSAFSIKMNISLNDSISAAKIFALKIILSPSPSRHTYTSDINKDEGILTY